MDGSGLEQWLPSLIAAAVTVLAVFAMRSIESHRWAGDVSERTFRKQVYTFGILLLGTLVVIFVLPEGANQDLAFGVIGLVVTGALAISSQSIIANGMAGLLLRSLKKFKPGDFIEVDGREGRVTELGLFHTEIQTNDRDLTTVPNSLMVNHPVKVVRASGTIVSANVSIGYDVSRHTLKPLLLSAAETAELAEPFVQVVDLGDYSVVYRVAGFLDTPERLLGVRSKLRGAMLDILHEAGIEIMSPMYVATRNRDEEVSVPALSARPRIDEPADDSHGLVFDKAEIAGAIETHRRAIADARARVAQLEEELGADGADHESIRRSIETLTQKVLHLNNEIEDLEAMLRSD
ncbi:MAG: mechanosensitive ion channel [Acidimicrobiales bacterium]|nr:mechanosensitive ion channel [Acidimicrobiales bacterium]